MRAPCFIGGYAHGILWNPFGGNSQSQTSASQPTASTSGATSPAVSNGGEAAVGTGSAPTIVTTGNVTIPDDNAIAQMSALVQQALAGAASIVNNVVDGAATAVATTQANEAAQSEANAQLTTGALNANQTLAAAGQSGGQTTTDSTLIYIVLAALGALAAILIWGKK